MKIEILSDVPVSPNLESGDLSIACAYPLTARLPGNTLTCVYRQGANKHSHDGRLMCQISHDQGTPWSPPRTIFDGLLETPTQTVVTGGLCRTPSGALLCVFGSVEGLRPDIYMFDTDGASCPRHVFLVRSEDAGTTWSVPNILDLSPLGAGGITARPFVAPDGAVCIPVE